jgi:hypothetical protein
MTMLDGKAAAAVPIQIMGTENCQELASSTCELCTYDLNLEILDSCSISLYTKQSRRSKKWY